MTKKTTMIITRTTLCIFALLGFVLSPHRMAHQLTAYVLLRKYVHTCEKECQ